MVNGKIYIGKHSTDNIYDGYMGSGTMIKRSINKYGLENFTKEYLAFCDNEETLNYLERYYIKKYKSTNVNIGYNITGGGNGCLGLTHSQETKEKIRCSCRGKVGCWNKGKHLSAEHKQKLHNFFIGRPTGRHISGMLGKHHTEESKMKMKEKQHLRTKYAKGWHQTNEVKQKISDANKDKPKLKRMFIKPDGTIVYQTLNTAKRWHPDWKLIDNL